MLKSRFTKPLTLISMLCVLPVLAHSQAQTGAAAVPPPPGPYTALPAATQMRAASRAQSTPASQVWRAPQGQVLPYWMRTTAGNAAPSPRNAAPATAPTIAPATGPQYSPLGWATTPVTAYGQPNGGYYQGGQGYGNQGYQNFPPQMQMPYWGGPTAPYYPGFRPTYPAYGQYNR